MAKLQKVINEICDNRLKAKGKAGSVGGKVALWGLVSLIIAILAGIGWTADEDPVLSGLFIATFFLGLPTLLIGLTVLAAAGKEHPTISFWRRIQLLSMAEKFEGSDSTSGSDYGQFLIILERLKSQFMLAGHERDQIIATLKGIMLEKGRRVSGSDYIELEKELLRTGTVKVNDKSIQLFSRWDIERILEDYERLRETIRDRTLLGAAGEGGINVYSN